MVARGFGSLFRYFTGDSIEIEKLHLGCIDGV